MARADRGRLRRLLAGRRADPRHAGAAARAAVRGDLRLHGLAARRGCRARQGRRRARRRGGDAAGPAGHAGVRRDHRAAHASSSSCAPPARGCTCAACRAPAASSWCARPRPRACRSPATSAIHHLHLTDMRHRLLRLAMPPRAAAAQPARPRRAPRARSPTAPIDALVLRPHAGRRRREAPAVRRGRAGRHRARAAAAAALKWGEAQKLPLARRSRAITTEPARILGVDARPLARRRAGRRRDLRSGGAVRLAADAEEPGQEHAVPRLRARRPRALHAGRRQRRVRRMKYAGAARSCVAACPLRRAMRPHRREGRLLQGRRPGRQAAARTSRRFRTPSREPNRCTATPTGPTRCSAPKYVPLAPRAAFSQRGVASWYGTAFHGQKTASGEPYDMYAMTAAHPTLPIPSYVRVHGRSVVVRVNDAARSTPRASSTYARPQAGYIQAGSARSSRGVLRTAGGVYCRSAPRGTPSLQARNGELAWLQDAQVLSETSGAAVGPSLARCALGADRIAAELDLKPLSW